MNSIRAIMQKCMQNVGESKIVHIFNSNRCLKYAVPVLLGLGVFRGCLYSTGAVGPAKIVSGITEVGTLKPTVFGIGTVQASGSGKLPSDHSP